MSIELTAEHLAAIRAAGEESFPHECCGFLVGTVNEERKVVRKVAAADNAREAEARRNRYSIRPMDFLRAERRAHDEGLDIVGFYHSHPDAPARPSDYDTEHAWPWYSYVIVSVRDGKAGEAAAWVLRDDRSRFDRDVLITPGEGD